MYCFVQNKYSMTMLVAMVGAIQRIQYLQEIRSGEAPKRPSSRATPQGLYHRSKMIREQLKMALQRRLEAKH